MCLRFLSIVALLIGLCGGAFAQLRVCADPDNLPFSNRAQQGFENRIAELLSRATHQKLEYEWQRMGRGFVRDVLNKHKCDVVLGVPENFRPMLTTVPYYRSTYVFVTRRNAGPKLTSFDDPQLKHMKVGVQIVSEEYAPPAQALGRRGLVANLVGFESAGADAPSIINAVLKRRVSAAVVWGPLAGYYARPHPGQLQLTPTPAFDAPGLPLAFSISMGVRKGNVALRDELNRVLSEHHDEIHRILNNYGVPLIPIASETGRPAE
jgi:mxaJ protein